MKMSGLMKVSGHAQQHESRSIHCPKEPLIAIKKPPDHWFPETQEVPYGIAKARAA